MDVNNDALEQIGAMAIDVEMSLLLQRNELEEQAAGQSNETNEERGASISHMQEVSHYIQDCIQIKRNENRQVALMNSIEIVGLPDDICENTEDVANVLTEIIHFHIEEDNIRGFETVDDFTGPDLGQEGPVSVPSHVLVVHLVDLTLRNYILSIAQHTQLCFPGVGRVFIYEHLTIINRMIFRKALQEARRLHIQFVWIQDGKIYARKDRYSSVHQIRSDNDIKDMNNY